MYKVWSSGARRGVPRTHFAKYQANLKFYMGQNAPRKPEVEKKGFLKGVAPNTLSAPRIDEKFTDKYFPDETVDYTKKEQLEEVERMRNPRERDFYQDHTYHNEWIQRSLTDDQKSVLEQHYGWMAPGYQIKPWLWYPGDQVEITSGDHAGQRGTILNVVRYKNQCFVQNVNVQPITIPASESRPEQTIQREHPINVRQVRHIDPQTNEPCEVKLVRVRDKDTGNTVERRMSLATGVLLPVPKEQEDLDVGDPIRDTPLEDAQESTFMVDKEKPVMVARKLRAMEDHFVNDLRESYTRHAAYRAENTEHLRRYQQEVVRQAAGFLMETLIPRQLPDEVALEGGSSPVDESPEREPFVPGPHWREAVADVKLPEYDPKDVEDLHGQLDLDNPAHGQAPA